MNTEIKDEGELTPEERQEKADEAFGEIDEGSLDIVNALANHNAITKVINEGIKKVK